MAGLLTNFRTTILVSLGLAAMMIVAFGFSAPGGFDRIFLQAALRWAHVGSGILWIGLLYYFNFVQIRVMPQIPTEQKITVTRYIAPEALFWFRWSALSTVVFALALMACRSGTYSLEVLSFGLHEGFAPGDQAYILMGVGVYLALIMFLNVWGVIWPNQKRALNIGMGQVELDEETRIKAARVAMLASRTNLLLSLPMLTSMAMYQTLFG
jgi:uncharacterized membrane protein